MRLPSPVRTAWGGEPRAYGPRTGLYITILLLTSFVTLASPYFTQSCLSLEDTDLGRGGVILSVTGRAGLGAVGNSPWNGYKPQWGRRVWAEEIMAMVGDHLCQGGLDSPGEGEALSPAKDILLGSPLTIPSSPNLPTPPPGI